MERRIVLLLFGFLCGLPLYIYAQYTSPLRLFEEGKVLFGQQNYAAAQQKLAEFSRVSVVNPTVGQETDYMLACSSYELKSPGCITLLRHFLDKYPDSPNTNRVYALLASAYFFERKYDEAIALFNASRLYLLADKERDASAFRLATAYLEVGKLKDAAIWFRTLKESSGQYRADAVYNLSYIDYLQGRYQAALPGFLSLQDDKKYAELVPYYIAEIYLQQKNYDKSEIVAQNYLSAYSGNADIARMQRILGESEYGMGRYAAAIGPLTEYLRSINSPQRSVLYQLGMSYFHTRVYSQAAAILNRVVTEKDALSQNAYLHIGLAYLQLKDKNKARMAFAQASSTDFSPQVKEQALYNYALCVHETAYSPFDESVKVFERFLNEFPASVYAEKVSGYLVEVYMDTRSYEAALKSIAKISYPDTRILAAKQKILFRLGTQAFANVHFDKAIDYFDQSLALSRYNTQTKADAYYWRGEACFRLNRYESAERDFRLFLEFTTSTDNEIYGLSLYNLGYTAFKQKNYNVALKWFVKYVALAKSDNRKLLADAYNRMGDCYFHARNFADARESYSNAFATDSSLGDYALYQEAFVLGLQKDYVGKVHLLNKLTGQYPQSQYRDIAYYERGRAYVQMNDNSRAIDSFRELLSSFPESAAARKGANEIGLLYYQNDDYDNAIEAYKKVIISYPGSEEARLAQRDLKSIYIDLNRIDDYAGFIATRPGGIGFDASERDSLTYIAAEKIYMRGDVNAARKSLEKYLYDFPDGVFSLDAHYYIGLIDYNQKRYAEAQSHFEKVLEYPNNKFSEDAMVASAGILFDARDYTKALGVYKRLKEKASNPEKRQLAKLGMLRSSRLSGDAKETILAATNLLADSKLLPEQENEARLSRAKAYLDEKALKATMEDLQVLAKDTRNLYGAEAKYLLAQLYFDEGNTALAEKEVLDYIERSTPHAYWLARSFVLLSDVYVKMGRKTDARQYLLSLQENYQAKDDITGMIESRLKKLSK